MVINAYTIDQVAKLTGLSEDQLRRWDLTGIYHPSYPVKRPRSPYNRIYSFEDLVGLRTIATLKERGFSTRRLRALGEYLRTISDRPWIEQSFYIDEASKRIFFTHQDALLAENPPGQGAMPELFPLARVEREMRERVSRLSDRTPE